MSPAIASQDRLDAMVEYVARFETMTIRVYAYLNAYGTLGGGVQTSFTGALSSAISAERKAYKNDMK